MQIDWLTVAAQIVNFLVLIWLLQRFLYAPVTRAMDSREQRIAERLQDAEACQQQAQQEACNFRQKQDELDEQRDQVMMDARQAAGGERKRLEAEARGQIEQRRLAWLNQLEDQETDYLHDLKTRSIDHFYALARRALGDLANAQLEEQMVRSFIEKLQNLSDAEKKKIATHCRTARGAVAVHSRFALPSNERRLLTKVFHENIFSGAEVDYGVDDEAICGIELRTGGQVVTWSLDSYLDELEETMRHEVRGPRVSVPGRAPR